MTADSSISNNLLKKSTAAEAKTNHGELQGDQFYTNFTRFSCYFGRIGAKTGHPLSKVTRVNVAFVKLLKDQPLIWNGNLPGRNDQAGQLVAFR